MTKVHPSSGASAITDGSGKASESLYDAHDQQLELEGLLKPEDSNSVFSLMDSFIRDSREGLNAVLHGMSQHSVPSLFLVSIGIFIESLQVASYALPSVHEMDYHFPPSLDSIAETLSYSHVGLQLIEMYGAHDLIIATLITVAFIILTFMYFAHLMAVKSNRYRWATKILQLIFSLFVGVLFMPTLTVLSKVFKCVDLSEEECTLLFPVGIAVIAAFISISLFVTVSGFDPCPKSLSLTGKAHARFSVLLLLAKAGLVLLFSNIAEKDPSLELKTLWTSTVTVISTTLAAVFIYYQPNFNQNVCTVQGILMGLIAWFSLVSLWHVRTLQDENGESVTTLFWCGFVLSIFVSYLAINCRRYSLRFTPIEKCRGAFDVEMKGRFYIQGYGADFIPILSKADEAELRSRARVVHEWYVTSLKQFPSSSVLCIFHAHVLLDFLSSKSSILVRRAVDLADKRRIPLDFTATIYKTKHLLGEKASATDVAAYVKSEKLIQEAKNLDKACCLLLVDFWRELSHHHPSVSKVRTLALSIGKNISAARSAYLNLVTVSTRSARVLTLFGTFLVEIVNDPRLGSKVLQKAAQTQRRENAKSTFTQSLDDIQSEKVGVVLLQLDEESSQEQGAILACNAKASDILNEPAATLITRPVFTLFPELFGSALQKAIDGFLTTGNDDFLDESLNAFVHNGTRVFSPVIMKLKPHSLGGLNFRIYMTFIPLEEKEETKHYFLVDTSYRIIGASQKLTGLLGGDVVTRPSGQSGPRTLESYVQNFAENAIEIVRCSKQEAGIEMCVYAGNVDSKEERTAFQAKLHVKRHDCLGAEMLQVFVVPTEESVFAQEEVASIHSEAVDFDGDDLSFEPGAMGNAFDDVMEEYEGDAGTVTGSVSSSQAMENKASKIRKILNDQHQSKMDPALITLRRVYLVVSLLAIVVVLNGFMQYTGMLDEFTYNVDLVGRYGFRRFCMATIAYQAHSLAMIERGLIQDPNGYGEIEARERLTWAAETLKSIDRVMFQNHKSHPGLIQEMYSTTTTSYLYIRNNRLVVAKMSVYEAVLTICSLATQAASMPLETFKPTNPVYFSLMNNLKFHNSSILEQLQVSTKEFQLDTSTRQQQGIQSLQITSIVLACVLTVLVGYAIRPLVGNSSNIERSTHEVLDVFLKIHKAMTNQIADRYVNRLDLVHQNEMDDESDYEEQDNKSVAGRMSQGGHRKSRSKRRVAVSQHLEITGASAEAKEAPKKTLKFSPNSESNGSNGVKSEKMKRHIEKKEKRKKEKAKQQGFNTIWRRLAIFLKVSSLLVISLAYFLGTSLHASSVAKQIEASPGNANYAGYRRFTLRTVQHSLRLYMSGEYTNMTWESPESGEELFFDASAVDIQDNVKVFVAAHEKLLYGSSEDRVSGILKQEYTMHSAPQVELLTEDGCIGFIAQANVTYETCSNFMNGLVSSGLHPTIEAYAEKMMSLATEVGAALDGESSSTEEIIAQLERDDFLEFAELEHSYLQPQLTTAIRVYSAEAGEYVAIARQVALISVVVYVVVVVFIYLFVIRTLLRQLDVEVKRTRSLLLIIPEDVLEQMKHVQRFIVQNFS